MSELCLKINWLFPYYKSDLFISVPYKLVVQLFASCEYSGIKINSSSPFNQGKYKVSTNNNLVQIKGAYGKSRFPLVTEMVIQPIQSEQKTIIKLESRPTLQALIPLSLLGLLMGILCVPIILESGLKEHSDLLILLLFPYFLVVLFFNIELRALINVIRERASSIRLQ